MAESQPPEGKVDARYYRGVPGILKMIELVFLLIGFICATVTICINGLGVKEYFQFATMGSFIFILLLWIILLLKLQKRVLKCDCVNWPFFEFMVYVVILISLFFACLFISLFACDTARKAAAFFSWVAFFTFVVDFVLSFRIFLITRKASRAESPPEATPYNPDTQARF